MCFSATASFTGAALLTITGIATFGLKLTKRELMLALIPFLFAFQQFNEGWLWILLPEGTLDLKLTFAKYGFLFVALAVWPFWIPMSLFMYEERAWRKRIFTILSLMGALYCLQMCGYLLYWIFANDVPVEIIHHHIEYQYTLFPNDTLYGIGYLVCTLMPPFFSSSCSMRILGIGNLLAFAISEWLYTNAFVSVWCFFAAWTSIGIYLVLRYDRQKAENGADI